MTAVAPRSGLALVWNKGIAAECDRRLPDEFGEAGVYKTEPNLAGALYSSRLPEDLIARPEVFDDVRDGELIAVRLSWLKSFVVQALPRIRSRFVLLTYDSDSSVSSELGRSVTPLLESPKLIRWFAQNYDGSLPGGKVEPAPIGIDFHTLAEKAAWGEPKTAPKYQEETLLAVRRDLAPATERLLEVYVDFAWQKGFGLRHYRRFHPLHGTTFRESRRKIARMLTGRKGVFCQTGPLPRTEMWRRRGEYAFVLSPHGVGLDCHRTWEALALGHIVLVPSSSLDKLYEGLPVIVLKDWDEINQQNLPKWLDRYEAKPQIAEQLTISYWVDQMKKLV